MLKKLRRALADVDGQKLKHFADLEKIIQRIRREHASLFPAFRVNKDGSRCVFDWGIAEMAPISLEKEHGSRDCLPHKYAKRAIHGIEDVLDYIEEHTPANEEIELGGEASHESTGTAEEAAGPLSQPELPNRGGGE